MRKLIAAINVSLDGFCDHTAMQADDETHGHYSELLRNTGVLLYGRTTYQLMENYWPSLVKNPSGNKASDDFALLIDRIPKIVYSRSLMQVNWQNITLKNEILSEEIMALKQQEGKDLVAGSPGLIAALIQLDLIDEYQICVHPVIVGSGQALFKNTGHRHDLKLTGTKSFACGAIVLYYQRLRS